jgi:hypothetical protein
VVHPGYQGQSLGKAIVLKLTELSAGHRKIILYANPDKESFYEKLGFRRMRTAMAIFQDQDRAVQSGLIEFSTPRQAMVSSCQLRMCCPDAGWAVATRCFQFRTQNPMRVATAWECLPCWEWRTTGVECFRVRKTDSKQQHWRG